MVKTKTKWYGDKEKKDMINANVRALIRSANIVESDATLIAPEKTGNLRSSIERSEPLITKLVQKIKVFTNVEYAPFVEFGTRFQRSQPYLRPALIRNAKKIIEIFKKEGKKATGN